MFIEQGKRFQERLIQDEKDFKAPFKEFKIEKKDIDKFLSKDKFTWSYKPV
ncbi:MAG: hypothetical protein IPO06_06750 [Leptospiraceae bacterium]|nr:hypothetical protein [Leptospiraceae bacterium]